MAATRLRTPARGMLTQLPNQSAASARQIDAILLRGQHAYDRQTHTHTHTHIHYSFGFPLRPGRPSTNIHIKPQIIKNNYFQAPGPHGAHALSEYIYIYIYIHIYIYLYWQGPESADKSSRAKEGGESEKTEDIDSLGLF